MISIDVGWQPVQCGMGCGIETAVEMALLAALCLATMGRKQDRNCYQASPGRRAGLQPDVLRRCARKNSGWIVFSASTGRPENPF